MKAFVSRRSLRLRLSRRFSTSPGLLYNTVTFCISFPKLPQVPILFLTAFAIQAGQTAGVIAYPILRTGTQDQATALPRYGEAISGGQAHLPQEVGRQRDLVLAADCAHGRLFPAAGNILNSSLCHFTFLISPCQVTHRFTLRVHPY